MKKAIQLERELQCSIQNAWNALCESKGEEAESHFGKAQEYLLMLGKKLKKYRKELHELDNAIWNQYMLDSGYEETDWEKQMSFFRNSVCKGE